MHKNLKEGFWEICAAPISKKRQTSFSEALKEANLDKKGKQNSLLKVRQWLESFHALKQYLGWPYVNSHYHLKASIKIQPICCASPAVACHISLTSCYRSI